MGKYGKIKIERKEILLKKMTEKEKKNQNEVEKEKKKTIVK